MIPNSWRGAGTTRVSQAGDSLSVLEAQPNRSLGAVFSSGVIERLAVSSQWHLLERALHTLHPGGLFIAETLNPHSVSAMRMLAMSEVGQYPVFPEVALGMWPGRLRPDVRVCPRPSQLRNRTPHGV